MLMAPAGVMPAARCFFGEGYELGVVLNRAALAVFKDELVAGKDGFPVYIAVHIGAVCHGGLLSSWPGQSRGS